MKHSPAQPSGDRDFYRHDNRFIETATQVIAQVDSTNGAVNAGNPASAPPSRTNVQQSTPPRAIQPELTPDAGKKKHADESVLTTHGPGQTPDSP